MIIKKYSFSKIFFWAGIISLSIIYMILWAKMIRNPAERTGTDFIIFWTAGRISQKYDVSQVYNIELQTETEANIIGLPLKANEILPFNHPPHSLPFLIILVGKNYIKSFSLWALLNIAFYIYSFFLLMKGNKTKPHDLRQNLKIAISLLLFFPIFTSILLGQDTAILFFGVTLLIFGTKRNDNLLIALGLTLASIRPHIAIVLATVFFFHHKKTLKYFMVVFTIFSLLSFFALGNRGTQDFVNVLLISATQKGYGIKPDAMMNLSGLLTRSFPALKENIIRFINWGAYGISTIFLLISFKREKKFETTHITQAIIFSLFFAPHLNYHDLSLLAIPVYLLLTSKNFPFTDKYRPLIALTLSLSLIFTQPIPFLYYSLPYLLMLLLIVFTQKESKTHKNKDSFSNA